MVTTTVSEPLTLQAAHELMVQAWPGRNATRSAWLAYYRRAVVLYTQVAKTDAAHANEARYWAGQAIHDIRELGETHE